jgi:transposase
MRKIDYKNEILESESALREAYKKLLKPQLQERCEILIWLKTGQVKTMKEAMHLKNRSLNHGTNLWKLYKKSGLGGYLQVNYRPQKSPLWNKKEFQEHLTKEGFSTINEARLWILKTYEIEYTENGLGNYFRNAGIKLKTGRPHHPKKDEEKRAAYKKNLSPN